MELEQIKKTADKILDYLHIQLVKFRVLSVSGFYFSCWLLNDAWAFYKMHYSEYEGYGSAACIGVFIMGFLGFVKYTLENVVKKHEGHGEQ